MCQCLFSTCDWQIYRHRYELYVGGGSLTQTNIFYERCAKFEELEHVGTLDRGSHHLHNNKE